jgi:hypothetical protein
MPGGGLSRAEGDRHAGLDDVAAQAVAAIHLAFADDELVGQALVRHQVELFGIGRIQAHGAGIGTQRRRMRLEIALAQGFQRRRLAEKGRDVVEDAQFAVALGQAVRVSASTRSSRVL